MASKKKPTAKAKDIPEAEIAERVEEYCKLDEKIKQAQARIKELRPDLERAANIALAEVEPGVNNVLLDGRTRTLQAVRTTSLNLKPEDIQRFKRPLGKAADILFIEKKTLSLNRDGLDRVIAMPQTSKRGEKARLELAALCREKTVEGLTLKVKKAA